MQRDVVTHRCEVDHAAVEKDAAVSVEILVQAVIPVASGPEWINSHRHRQCDEQCEIPQKACEYR
jgi:hypothetical protein